MAKSKFAKRHRARQLAAQALYQRQLNGDSARELITQFAEDRAAAKVDFDYFRELVEQVIGAWDDLALLLEPLLDRSFTALDPVERGLLLLGAYEMRERRELPCRVVINEGIELARLFGGTESHRYVNSILDRLARELRPLEFGGQA